MLQKLLVVGLVVLSFFAGVTYTLHCDGWVDEERLTFCLDVMDNIFEWDI